MSDALICTAFFGFGVAVSAAVIDGGGSVGVLLLLSNATTIAVMLAMAVQTICESMRRSSQKGGRISR